MPPQYLDKVLLAYNGALSDTFKVSVVCVCLTLVAGLTMEWKSVKKAKQGGPPSPKIEENSGDAHTETEMVRSSPITEPVVPEKEEVKSTAEESSKTRE